MATALACTLAGCALGARGAALWARGASVLTLGLCVPACLQEHGLFVGALGNTGALSEAALPGALAGAWLAARAHGPWRFVGGAATLVHAFYTAVVPVHAGALALALGLILGWLALRGSGLAGRRCSALLALALVALGVGAGLRLTFPGTDPRRASRVEDESARAPASEPRSTGGFAVRLRIARTLPAMVAAGGFFGAGPGQFLAAYPPHRDPRELELSSIGREPGLERVVEHPHNDWLLPLVESGPLGGAAFLLFGLCTAVACLRLLRASGRAASAAPTPSQESEAPAAALALAWLGVGANAFLRAPLFANPAAASLSFACAGAVLAATRAHRDAPSAPAAPVPDTARALASPGPGASRSSPVLRILLAANLVLIAVQLPRASALIVHGRSLAAYFVERDGAGLARALAARPDSPLANALEARRLEASDPEQAREHWTRVLASRPFDVEASVATRPAPGGGARVRPRARGLHAGRRRRPRARGPGAQPRAARAARAAHGRGPRARRCTVVRRHTRTPTLGGLDRRATDRARSRRRRSSARAAARSGRSADRRTRARVGPWSSRKPSASTSRGPCAARRTCCGARQHADAQAWSTAARSYRQAWSSLATTSAAEDEANLLALRSELAAALFRAGDAAAARERLAKTSPTGAARPPLPSATPGWVAAALDELESRARRDTGE